MFTDGGLETTLAHLEGLHIVAGTAFPLLDDAAGRQALEDYYLSYVQIASEHQRALVLDTPTRRASPSWGRRIDRDVESLDRANSRAVELLLDVRAKHTAPDSPIVVSGAVGPQSDDRHPPESAAAAADYHSWQIHRLIDAGAELITARGLHDPHEAIGIADVVASTSASCRIGFTVSRDGRMPGGRSLGEAIRMVDAATNGRIESFVIDCSPIEHIASALSTLEMPVLARVTGVRAHASPEMTHDLQQIEQRQSGEPSAFGVAVAALHHDFAGIRLLGGCCGTDERHLAHLARALGS